MCDRDVEATITVAEEKEKEETLVEVVVDWQGIL